MSLEYRKVNLLKDGKIAKQNGKKKSWVRKIELQPLPFDF